MARASLRSLQVFCASAELGSFKKAAMHLFVSPSAVSHQVKSLEEQLGFALYDRQSGRVELTAAGRTLFARINPLLSQIDEQVSKLSSDPIRHRVIIALPAFFATEVFIPRMAIIAEEQPTLDVRIVTTSGSVDGFPAGADLAVVLADDPPQGVANEALFPLHLLPVAAPQLNLTRDDLLLQSFDVPLIINRARRNAWRRWFEREQVDISGKLKLIELDTMFAVARAAEQGLGIALAPIPLANKWIESGALMTLCQHELPTMDRYFFCWRGERKPDFAESIFSTLKPTRGE